MRSIVLFDIAWFFPYNLALKSYVFLNSKWLIQYFTFLRSFHASCRCICSAVWPWFRLECPDHTRRWLITSGPREAKRAAPLRNRRLNYARLPHYARVPPASLQRAWPTSGFRSYNKQYRLRVTLHPEFIRYSFCLYIPIDDSNYWRI